jgi:hypothetical protein
MQGEGERLGQRSGVWKDNPDIKALWKLVAELKDRRLDEQLNADPFVARLKARLHEIAALSAANKRQIIGVNEEMLQIALAGGNLPPIVRNRLQAFVDTRASVTRV